jgi:Haloacid dehalogenase-like hydrolase
MSAPTLLFDLDGTLTDPRPGIVACMRRAVEGLGRRCPDDDALATFIGPPLRGTFATLLETDERETIEAAMALYRERFGVTGLFENRVYDGIPEMLVEVCPRAALDASLDAKATLVTQLPARERIAPALRWSSATAPPTCGPPRPTGCARSACSGATAPSASCARPAPTSSASSPVRWRRAWGDRTRGGRVLRHAHAARHAAA